MTTYVEVALNVPLRRTFTYATELLELEVGMRVAVPFHGRTMPGIVLGLGVTPPAFKTKSIVGQLDDGRVFDDELLGFLREAADYYLHPIGEVLKAASPVLAREKVSAIGPEGAGVRGRQVATRRVEIVVRTDEPTGRLGAKQAAVLAVLEARRRISMRELEAVVPKCRAVVRSLALKGLVVVEQVTAPEDPFFDTKVPRDEPPPATPEQERALVPIEASLRAAESRTFLLHGVTGSGKTEVYLRAIATCREMGRGALLLVPEIALTPQLVGRFRARFGDGLAVLHSALTDKERDRAWKALRAGTIALAVGARSALLAPIANLGLVIVDEEHDPSYKQDEGFRYHARDMAILRAHRAGAVCILGSATPSLESYANASRGLATRLTLLERATKQTLPSVEVVDLGRTGAGPAGDPLLTLPLHRELEKTLARGEQAILFLNRRGFAPTMKCETCGRIAECPLCSIALTEHRRAQQLRCHTCDFVAPVGHRCTHCGGPLEPLGLGTEKVEDSLQRVFPSARIARLDRDVASGRGIEEVLARVRSGEVDILVGTQMVTKGHDLPNVTFVGVLLADQALGFPDVRASERTFQLLTQVAGRAGRAKEGRVLLQTFQPTQPAIVHATHHDYLAFAEDELGKRKELGDPPFGRLVAVRIDDPDERRAEEVARSLAELARTHAQHEVEVLGPAPAPIAKVRGRFRFRFLLRSPQRKALRRVALAVLTRIEEGLGPTRAHVDIDPIAML